MTGPGDASENAIVISPQGEAALRVQFTDPDRVQRWRAVQQLRTRLRALALPSLQGVAATYDSALVEFDPLGLSGPDLSAILDREAKAALTDPAERTDGSRHFRIPACYELEHGPDLPLVAETFGTGIDDIRQRHAQHPHLVWSYGAPAAAPLMDGLGGDTSVPRRTNPRTRVPQGSLALAGRQSIIYTVPAPGGWQLIGRTPVRLVRARDDVCAYRAGDYISYFPITSREWERYAGRDLEEFGV